MQKRCRHMENELSKKSAEIRELLLQLETSSHPTAAGSGGSGSGAGNPTPPDSAPPMAGPPSITGSNAGASCSSDGHRSSSAVTMELLTESAEMRPVMDNNHHRSSDIDHHLRRKTLLSSALPKIELKSPARVIEEKEFNRASPVGNVHAAAAASIGSSQQIQQRHRSGTPTSTKSRVSFRCVLSSKF